MTGLRGNPLHWGGRERVTPAPTEFRPRKRVLELSCGVCSLQQVPWWTPTGEPPSVPPSCGSFGGMFGGGRRARKARRFDYAPAGVPLPFCLRSMIMMQAGATAGQV